MFRLKRHDQAPPGEYPYEQTVGLRKKFPKTVDIYGQAQAVADFRKGNNLPRGTFEEALQDIDEYTCVRLGNMPRWCRDSQKPYAETTPKLQKKLGGCCGARVQ